MDCFRVLVFFVSLITYIEVANAHSCLETNSDNGPPEFRNYGAQTRLVRYHQAIIPGYRLGCYGNITEWGVDVHRGGQGANERYTLDLQVWRPSPTVNDSTGTGCYSLVGNNRFTSISLRNLVARVTPSPQGYIQFRPGDVLGFYVEESDADDDGVVVVTSDSFTSEVVWYGSIPPVMATSQNGGCPYSVGEGGVLNTLLNAAPVVSIALTNTYLCSANSPQAQNSLSSCFNLAPSNAPTSSNTESRGQSPTTAQPPVSFPAAALVVIVTIVLVSAVIISIAAVIAVKALKLKRARYTSVFIPTATNAAYGVTGDISEMEINDNSSCAQTYDYPAAAVITDLSSSMVVNQAYLGDQNREDDFQTHFQDASNVIED